VSGLRVECPSHRQRSVLIDRVADELVVKRERLVRWTQDAGRGCLS